MRPAPFAAAPIGARRDFLHRGRDGLVAAIGARVVQGVHSVTRLRGVAGHPGLATPAAAAAVFASRGVGATTSSDPAALPTLAARFERTFDVHYGEYGSALRVAVLAYRFAHADGRYRATTEGEAVGLVALVYSGRLRQASHGGFDGAGLTPLGYVEKRGKRAERSIAFDPATRTMTGTGTTAPVPYPPATQDRLSIFFHLAWALQRDPARAANGSRFRVPLASTKSVDIVTVSSDGPSMLDIDGERVSTTALRLRNEDKRDDPRIDVWLSADGQRMPVRIRFEESDGTVVDQIHRRHR